MAQKSTFARFEMILNFLLIFVFSICGLACSGKNGGYLEIDNHPCRPEKLKKSHRYMCDEDGKVICLEGWRNPLGSDHFYHNEPCLEPICSQGCVNGNCVRPDVCACEIGWESEDCSVCVSLPGCLHGACEDSPFQCKCEEGWEGPHCDVAICDNCIHGTCVAPNVCLCSDGWSGPTCSDCAPRAGCLNGKCIQFPHTCICDVGWEGALCDKIRCNNPCIHGFCHGFKKEDGSVETFCICESGWQGKECSQCRPYWRCPNKNIDACNHPNECFCFNNEYDPNGICNNTMLKTSNVMLDD